MTVEQVSTVMRSQQNVNHVTGPVQLVKGSTTMTVLAAKELWN